MPRLNLKGKKDVAQTKDKRRGKPGRESRMCKSMDAVGAWHLLERVVGGNGEQQRI